MRLNLFRRGREPEEPPPAQDRSAADCRKEAADQLLIWQWCVRGALIVGALAMAFTMVNVQIFAAQGHEPGTSINATFHWVIAWLLDPMASLALVVAIVLQTSLARYDKGEPWLHVVKWTSGVATWAANIWPSFYDPHPFGVAAGVFLHSIAPALLLGLAEAAPRARRKMTSILQGLEREAQAIEAAAEAERVAQANRVAAEREREQEAKRAEVKAEQDKRRQLELERERATAAERQMAADLVREQADRAEAERLTAQAEADRARAEVEAAEAMRLETEQQLLTGPATKQNSNGNGSRGRGRAKSNGKPSTGSGLEVLPGGTTKDRMRRLVLQLADKGQDIPSGNQLDRRFGSSGTGSKVLADLRREGLIPPADHEGPWEPDRERLAAALSG